MKSQHQVIYERRNVVHTGNQSTSEIELDLVSIAEGGQNAAMLPSNVWRTAHSNRSDIYLHVILYGDQLDRKPESIISSKHVKSGEVLHGVVGLIKYDTIPRHYGNRYLLSDFGLVNISDEDGKDSFV